MTSPSRKIDPATTIRGDARHAASSASPRRRLRSRSAAPARSRAPARRASSGSAERAVRRARDDQRPTAGSSAREHAARRPCRASPRRRAAAASPACVLQVGRERRGAGRVVRGVEQQLAAVRRAGAISSRPGHRGCASPAAIARSRHGDAARVEQLQQRGPRPPRSRADARRRGRSSCPSPSLAVGADRRRRRALRGDLLDRRAPRPARSGPTTTGTPGLMMPAFSTRDLAQRRARDTAGDRNRSR